MRRVCASLNAIRNASAAVGAVRLDETYVGGPIQGFARVASVVRRPIRTREYGHAEMTARFDAARAGPLHATAEPERWVA
jgi:hypothetical protein